MKSLSPPNWAPNAIPTDRGWTHPNTGELLVSYRGLKTLLDNQKKPVIMLDIGSRTARGIRGCAR